MKSKILIVGFIILAVALVFTGCQKITQANIDNELNRWWVIYYKMLEDEIPGQTSEFVAGPDGVDRTLEYEFGRDFLSVWNDGASIKVKYRYAKRRNELMEKALIKFKGEDALKEIEGVWSLDEVPDLWEKVNNANE
ncbi:unnamed protein product [marine sediment metagenome]|uniref:Uncharacterized protein n=1 Tax=marine sediment metagenome TaxID=412755 RepID=X1SBA0_9ZZZZ